MNKHTIHGRLVRDPDFFQGENESKDRAKFTVAVDRSYGDEADFFDCIIFGKRASVVEKYFSKGKEILIEGEGRIGSYTGKDGVKRKTYTIVVGDFDFCGSAKDSGQKSSNKTQLDLPDNFEEQEEDIPF